MLTEDRSVFVLVRSIADLERACRELAGLLSALRQRGASAAMTESLLGIWVDERGMVDLPAALELGESTDVSRSARMVEATGVSGIWMMCSLETAPRTASRVDLLGALVRAFVHGEGDQAPGRFLPVFARDMQADRVMAEMQGLESRYPGLLLAPLYQDPCTGTLDLPPEPRLLPESSPQRVAPH